MLVPSRENSTTFPRGGARTIGVFGSTGSIGKSTLDVVRCSGGRFVVRALVAQQSVDAIVAQAVEFRPDVVGLADAAAAAEARSKLCAHGLEGIQVIGGSAAIEALAAEADFDTAVAAMVGSAGLSSVLRSLESGKRVALANKETLVAGGPLVAQAIARGGGALLPVDSEHSAIFQALQGSQRSDVVGLVLTASGGPFRETPLVALSGVTPEQAVRHPRWAMGPKISVDSATLMNKALELIEAAWLFGIPENRIEVVLHPESIVHSAVRFSDGSVVAQMSVPDMRGPISYALSFPDARCQDAMPQLSFPSLTLHFSEVDPARYPALGIAREALRSGPGATASLNAANEVAVREFLRGQLRFDRIVPIVGEVVEECGASTISAESDLARVEQRAREIAERLCARR